MGLQLLQLEQWSILWRRLAKEKKKKVTLLFSEISVFFRCSRSPCGQMYYELSSLSSF